MADKRLTIHENMKILYASPEPELKWEDPTIDALWAADTWMAIHPGDIFPASLRATFTARMLAQEICKSFGIQERELSLAIHYIREGMAIPSPAFVTTRDVAIRLKGRPLLGTELKSLVDAIKEQGKTK